LKGYRGREKALARQKIVPLCREKGRKEGRPGGASWEGKIAKEKGRSRLARNWYLLKVPS